MVRSDWKLVIAATIGKLGCIIATVGAVAIIAIVNDDKSGERRDAAASATDGDSGLRLPVEPIARVEAEVQHGCCKIIAESVKAAVMQDCLPKEATVELMTTRSVEVTGLMVAKCGRP